MNNQNYFFTKRVTSENIIELDKNEIFVFGSNEQGAHGGGAARTAKDSFGAKWGEGFGQFGSTFAIPTKDMNIKTLPLKEIKIYVDKFIIVAKDNSIRKYLVTEIGCGLAGYRVKDIAPLFREVLTLKNVYLPVRFWEYLIG